MKKITVLPVLAIILAIGFSAFTPGPRNIKQVDPWWYYKDNATDESNPANYEPYTSQGASCVGVVGVRCIIEAPVGDPGFPLIDGNELEVSYKP